VFSRKLLVLTVIVALSLGLPALALALGFHGSATARAPAATRLRTSQTTSGKREVGALFPTATSADHDCTATVVDSPRGDVLLTAAHCVSGDGAGMVFAPEFHHGVSSEGRWTVTAAYLAPNWRSSQAPADDFAFLTVAPRTIGGHRTEIQQITGADELGGKPRVGEAITVLGYPIGTDNDAVTCQTKVYFTGSEPTFDCRGYVAGTSGGPWLAKAAHGLKIVGIIGGRNQGGCIDSTSYSPLLTRDAQLAYARAAAHDQPDLAPIPKNDGC
jgi:V8-like Glu-specific endopeptidase